MERVRLLLRLRYFGYVLIPAPSFAEHVAKRGFDHVPLAFSSLPNQVLRIIEKTEDVKQSDRSKRERKAIGKALALSAKPDLSKKKVLFVDDVYTTGSTTRACVSLISKLHPRKIEVLVLSKVSKT